MLISCLLTCLFAPTVQPLELSGSNAPFACAVATFVQDPPVVEDEDEDKPPTKEEIEAMVETIKIAFGPKTTVAERLDAVEAARTVPADDVAKALEKGLKDDELEITLATLLVLAKMDVDEALDQLVSFHKKDKRLKKDDQLLADTLKAIAWHGDEDTVDLFSKNLFSNTSNAVIKARIYGLGMIREPEAVEALMDILKASTNKQGNQNPYMAELELALTVLVGDTDCGKNQAKWIAWWNDNKRDLDISEVMPEINKNQLRVWNNYWGIKNEPREKEGGGR